MVIAVTSLGVGTDNSGASTCQIPGVTAPAGSLICVWVFERNTSGNIATVSDTAGNTYPGTGTSRPPNSVNANGISCLFYTFNAKPLNGDTITYTKTASGSATGIAALYATGIQRTSDPKSDQGTTWGNSSTPFATGGTYAALGELTVASIAWVFVAGDTFTNDPIYRAPPDVSLGAVSSVGIAGGFYVSPVAGSPNYNSRLNNVRPWAGSVVSFLPEVPYGTSYTGVLGMAENEC